MLIQPISFAKQTITFTNNISEEFIFRFKDRQYSFNLVQDGAELWYMSDQAIGKIEANVIINGLYIDIAFCVNDAEEEGTKLTATNILTKSMLMVMEYGTR